MSYHPYAAARDHRTSSSARPTSTPAGYSELSVTASSSAKATNSNTSYAPSDNYAHDLEVPESQISNTGNSDDQVLPTDAEIDQEIYEAKIARNQGLISTIQYLDIVCAGLEKGSALLERESQGLDRARRGEDSRELIQRDSGRTDAEMDADLGQVERIIRIQLTNERRGEARRLRRAVTRGQ
ncbi:hypothetical protein EVG20_g6054 [Dentipellis fragilis]|uniref:Uncharacterized protein n=1 Tax=Dentipellis fragilis TaxID=205917 RepID=A0A4Y9YQR1_9AGAM|nr:hypothetical protein EVG20_g6054 [Dentipellis fragilis]